MSYILDALKRAEADRERGAVPGLGAQPEPAELGEPPPAAHRVPGWVWAAGGLALGMAGLLGWRQLSPPEPPAAAAPLPIQPVTVINAASASAPMPPASSTALPATPAAVAPPPSPAATPAPAPTAKAAEPAPAAAAPRTVPKSTTTRAEPEARAPDKKAAKASAAARESTEAPGSASAVAPAASARVETRVYALGELPDDVRRGLPTIAIGGAMYSANPSNRLLIVSGQLLREGDMAAPNVFIERINLRSAVLRFRGYLYEVTF